MLCLQNDTLLVSKNEPHQIPNWVLPYGACGPKFVGVEYFKRYVLLSKRDVEGSGMSANDFFM